MIEANCKVNKLNSLEVVKSKYERAGGKDDGMYCGV